MPKIADIWKLGTLNTPIEGDVPHTWAQRVERNLKWLERILRLLHLRVEQATELPSEVRRYTVDDFSVTNDTLVSVPNLSFDLEVGTYTLYARLVYDCGAGGTKYTIDGTATYTSALWHSTNQNDATGAYAEMTRHTVVPDFAFDTTLVAGIIELRGLLTVATAGTVGVQFAQRTPDAAASTVLAGSWFEVHAAANPL